jgi:hypothetical protein
VRREIGATLGGLPTSDRRRCSQSYCTQAHCGISAVFIDSDLMAFRDTFPEVHVAHDFAKTPFTAVCLHADGKILPHISCNNPHETS